jgi:hypothetical protein
MSEPSLGSACTLRVQRPLRSHFLCQGGVPIQSTKQLLETLRFLRSDAGCPWDRKQTLADMCRYWTRCTSSRMPCRPPIVIPAPTSWATCCLSCCRAFSFTRKRAPPGSKRSLPAPKQSWYVGIPTCSPIDTPRAPRRACATGAISSNARRPSAARRAKDCWIRFRDRYRRFGARSPCSARSLAWVSSGRPPTKCAPSSWKKRMSCVTSCARTTHDAPRTSSVTCCFPSSTWAAS